MTETVAKWDNVFQKEVASQIIIKKSSVPKAGKGAFWGGSHPLPPRRRIGVYAGRKCRSDDDIADTTYTLQLGPRTFINATVDTGNWTRYINDGNTHGENNLMFTKDGRLCTLCTIYPGDEFFVSYGDEYWSSRRRH